LYDDLQIQKQSNLIFVADVLILFVIFIAYWSESDSNASFLIAVDFLQLWGRRLIIGEKAHCRNTCRLKPQGSEISSLCVSWKIS